MNPIVELTYTDKEDNFMTAFNGALPTPINQNSASKIREILDVPSNQEMEDSIAQSTAIIEKALIPAFTVPANSQQSLSLSHTKAGYTCWFLNYYEYRTSASWFVHVKDVSANSANIDVVNTSSTAFTVSTANAVWLCIPTT